MIILKTQLKLVSAFNASNLEPILEMLIFVIKIQKKRKLQAIKCPQDDSTELLALKMLR